MVRLLLAILLAWPLAGGPAAASGKTPHHDITLHLDPATGEVSARDAVRMTGGGPTVFHLSTDFSVTGVTVDGRPAPPGRHANTLRIDLGRSGDHVVAVSYRGRLEPLAKDSPAWGSGKAAAGPDGGFLPAGSGWYPWPDEGSLFTYRLDVEVPEGQRVVAPGRLVEEAGPPGHYRAVFASEAPTDGIALMTGPYVVEERMHGDIRLRTYFHREIASQASAYLESTAAYIDRYAARIGPYPFSAFHIVSSPLPVGLGYPGLTYMGTRVLRLPFIRHTSLGHEVLHNWWGNGVYANYATGNWSEGLTTFMADYAYARDRGPQKALNMRLGWLRNYAALPPDRDRPAVAFVSRHHDAAQVVGYNKVAFFFHMLRAELGAAAFDAGIRRFWRTWKFRIAAWRDLRRAFEQEAGRGLGAFFDQWLRRTGAPRLVLKAVKAIAGDGGTHRVSFTLAQEGPAYALTVPVEVSTEVGARRVTVFLDGPSVEHTVETDGRPRALAVDPDFDLFRRLDAAEAPPILRDVTLHAGTATILLADDHRWRAAAESLARRILDAPARFADARSAPPQDRPLLVIGATGAVARFLDAAGLPPVPGDLKGRGTARVWAARHGAAMPLVVIAADHVEALEALLRPLPHYGRRGYLVFDGPRAKDHGNWPAGAGPLRVRLD
jgi:hypothetical protein